jgi:hypothetical protein
LRHAQKVEAMSDAAFPDHIARLNAMSVAAAPTIDRLARELAQKACKTGGR